MRMTIQIPCAETLKPFSEPIRKLIKVEIQNAGDPIGNGIRIKGEALFEILQKHSKLRRPGINKTVRLERKKAAIKLIKSVLTPDGDQYPKLIYGRYEEAAKIAGEVPYSYAWFRIIYAEIR